MNEWLEREELLIGRENIEKLKDMYTLDLIVKQDKNIKPGKLEIKVLEKYPEFLEDYK